MKSSELALEMERVPDVDESSIYSWIVSEPYQRDCPEPFGLMIGDYEFSHQPPYRDLLRRMGELAAASCCPFVARAAPELWGASSWNDPAIQTVIALD
jgi:predicted component of type VI protein secretion system